MKTFSLIILLLSFANCNGILDAKKQSTLIDKNVVIDSIVVIKSEREMLLFSNHKKIKAYSIGLGKEPVGKKHFEGDGKTPEGLYYIDAKSAYSKYHKNLNISYPNKDDIKYATENDKSAGGEIKIHGLPNSVQLKNYVVTDWTLGCIALTNDEIDELFEHVKLGSPILILP
ncbi:MAG TPA: L,D-transpeptidase family protein [Chitinophagales bacterium]|nr:L,D-transpeptidase family protein [Chitinophagales bacterium]